MVQRHAARPTLESVEDRMVLSSAGLFNPAEQARAALAGLVAHHPHASPALASHHAAAHGGKAGARTAPYQTTKAAHHPHHPHHSSSSSSSSSSLTNSFSNFLKSIGL